MAFFTLSRITSQAASALQNAQLFEQVQRAREEEAQLLAVTTAISTELHLLPLLQRIMETTTTILNADRSTLFLYDDKTQELWSQVAQGEESRGSSSATARRHRHNIRSRRRGGTPVGIPRGRLALVRPVEPAGGTAAALAQWDPR